MTDRLTLTRAFEGAGLKSDAAERIATEIYDAIHDNVATKQDLERIEAALKADLARVEAALKVDLAAVRVELLGVEQRLDHKIDTMANRIVAAMVVALTILFAALHYWPPQGMIDASGMVMPVRWRLRGLVGVDRRR